MSLELIGTIKEIYDTQTFPSGFSKREFVITTEEQYPQHVKFEMVKERADILQSCAIGEKVKVSFNVRGNEYQGKYYVSLQGWRVEKNPSATTSAPASNGAPAGNFTPMSEVLSNNATMPASNLNSEISDDLPF
jgi:single-strand DNA-binding protein